MFTRIMLKQNLLRNLEQSRHIQKCPPEQACRETAREQQSLSRLRQQCPQNPALCFLNLYDRLFRHVSLQLLAQGYVLTSYQPHQTLIAICTQYDACASVRHTVQYRHRLKKTPLATNHTDPQEHQPACLCLHRLLSVFSSSDADDCQLLLDATLYHPQTTGNKTI
nr:hypothetical protein LVJ77_01445 [Conchiformibius kuhniae]